MATTFLFVLFLLAFSAFDVFVGMFDIEGG
jgi:hypothetical protein